MEIVNNRIIHTHLYSKIAKEVISAVFGQFSDGKWENSPSMEKYWMFTDVEVADNGEVVLVIKNNTNTYSGSRFVENKFKSMTDQQVLDFIANHIKIVAKDELKDRSESAGAELGWKRTNHMFTTGYLSYDENISIADVYFIYDWLHHRDTTKNYDNDMHLRVHGLSRSAEETKRAHDSKVAKDELRNKYYGKKSEIDSWELAEIAKIRAEAASRRSAAFNSYHEAELKLAA